jgi:hypothetical protein
MESATNKGSIPGGRETASMDVTGFNVVASLNFAAPNFSAN